MQRRRPTMSPMKLLHEPLPGLLEFELAVHGDGRGSFRETFNRATLAEFGVELNIVQDNESWSASRGTIRGLSSKPVMPPRASSSGSPAVERST